MIDVNVKTKAGGSFVIKNAMFKVEMPNFIPAAAMYYVANDNMGCFKVFFVCGGILQSSEATVQVLPSRAVQL